MKKEYRKPICYVESFTLASHISGGCGFLTNFGNQCPLNVDGTVFFTSADTCSEDGVSMMAFAGVTPETATVEQLIAMNVQCYNSFADLHSLFNS